MALVDGVGVALPADAVGVGVGLLEACGASNAGLTASCELFCFFPLLL